MKLLWPVWLRRLWRIVQSALLTLSVLVLVLTLFWLKKESDWGSWTPLTEADAFHHGTLGLETLPLKYLLVLEDVSGAQFSFRNGPHRPFTEAYGFITPSPPPGKSFCDAQTPDEVRAFLPVGFSVSNRLPQSATPVPLQFAGLTCALCHSSRIHTAGGKVNLTVIGAGSASIDLISWVDGFQNAVLDPNLTAGRIYEKYDQKCGGPRGLIAAYVERPVERIFLNGWLNQIRSSLLENMTQYDLPYSGTGLNDAGKIFAGPSRTRPFRSVVRTALNFPGQNNFALSKVPAVFQQRLKPSSQYDGSIDDHVVRSLIAAYTSGSSVEALSKDEVVHNIRAAADYTLHAGEGAEAPAYRSVFPDHFDPARAARGLQLYQHHCTPCHGYWDPDRGEWSKQGATHIGENVPLKAIGTDPYRVDFRYADILPQALQLQFPGLGADLQAQRDALANAKAAAEKQDAGALAGYWERLSNTNGDSVPGLMSLDESRLRYPAGHPFFIKPGVIHNGNPAGYLNGPIPRAWLRAPYLHNGSVPTLRQLIGLDPRQDAFCRGDNPYDPDAVGIVALPPGKDGCPADFGFLFDTRAPGNSNAGHNFPWARPTPAQREQLTDLLEYLKSL